MTVGYEHCAKWESGNDCKFNFYYFYVAASVVWVLTLIPLLVKTSQRGINAPSGATTWCLLLTSLSALLSLFDNLLFLALGEMHVHPYHLHMLTFIGSIFLVFALSLFAGLWCNVASALHSKVIHPPVPVKSLRTLRFGYIALACMHVPFAALKAISDVKEELGLGMIRRDEIAGLYAFWTFASACCTLTLFSFLMLRVTRSLGQCPNSDGFRVVTWVNFGQQIIYDVCLAALFALYYLGSYNEHGYVQAAFYGLYFIIYWLMHAQVLVFFSVVEKDDPLYARDNDVVGRSEVAIAPVCVRKPSEIEDISFSWEGGADINILIEEVKFGKRARARTVTPGSGVNPNCEDLRNHGITFEDQEQIRNHDFIVESFRETEEDEIVDPFDAEALPTPELEPAKHRRVSIASPFPQPRWSQTSISMSLKSRINQESSDATENSSKAKTASEVNLCGCGNKLAADIKMCSNCGARQVVLEADDDLEEGCVDEEFSDGFVLMAGTPHISLPQDAHSFCKAGHEGDSVNELDGCYDEPVKNAVASTTVNGATAHDDGVNCRQDTANSWDDTDDGIPHELEDSSGEVSSDVDDAFSEDMEEYDEGLSE